MRLRRLDLTRYGKFTERRLEFGPRVDGAPDLHIVYGPNEAGKSTAFSAFLDLLFGIETRSRYDFLHPYAAMRIGACLELAGGVQDLARIKRPQRSLLGADDQPVAEALLAGDLAGLDRAAYRTMFSLDDETLEAGGESILASKGDLGELLFSASAGLADLSRVLLELRGEAEGFHRLHGRATELAQLKATLAALKAEREQIDMLASTHARLAEARDLAVRHYEAALAERNGMHARMEEIRRQLAALPRLAALRDLQARLAPLADLPEVPDGWTTDLARLQAEEIALRTRRDSVDAQIAQISAEVDAIVVDDAALQAVGPRAQQEVLRARYLASEKDIPDRRRERAEADGVIAAILQRLDRAGEAEPRRLLLTAVQVAGLQDLIERRSGVDAAVEAASREHADATHRLNEAQQALNADAAAPPDETALALLTDIMAATRSTDHEARVRLTAQTTATLRARVAERLAALHPRVGDLARLAALDVPDTASVEGWAASLARAETCIAQTRTEIARLADEHQRLLRELSAMTAASGLVTDQEAARLRAEREAAWAAHRARLDLATAERFEAVLREDDIATQARAGHAQEVARLNTTTQQAHLRDAELRQLQARLATEEHDHDVLRRGIDTCLAAVGLPGGMAPARLGAWLVQRRHILEVCAELHEAEAVHQAAEENLAAACGRLQRGLGAAGCPVDPTTPLDRLLATAQTMLDRATRGRALQEAVAERRRALGLRERALQKATTDMRLWEAGWREACAATWLGTETVPRPAEMREILAVLNDLGLALQRHDNAAGRIADMQRDQTQFQQELYALAVPLGLDTGLPPLALAQAIDAAIEAAQRAQATREKRRAALEEARERRRRLADEMALHAARSREMIVTFGVGTLAEVGAKLREAERKAELARQAAEAERECLATLRVDALPDAVERLDQIDRAALESELADLEARLGDVDRRREELYAQNKTASDEIEGIGGDDAAARIDAKRRTVLLDIQDRALRHLRLRIGLAAANRALRTYRERHRTSMMQAASDAFRLISRGAYKGLGRHPDREEDVLIALPADGGAKMAADLSKGTRFQLYLALRAAGYQEFARLRPPVPFIADDIMETFDDFRAEEAFRLFADMARHGQVIYLTHHIHLCEIARRTVPVRILELA